MATGLYSKHLKDRKKLYLRNTVLIIILIVLALISLFPIVYMIAWSFGPAIEAASTSYSIFPKSWSLDSYKAFIQFNQYSLRWLWNSLVFAGMAGYAFAKIDFKGRKFLFYMVLMAMMIPYQVIQVPLYILLVSKFQLSNTYISLILPGICTSYNIFLAKQFFASIPTALIESARIEGCGQFKTYRLIVLPLSKTILAVMAINTFLGRTISSGRSWQPPRTKCSPSR